MPGVVVGSPTPTFMRGSFTLDRGELATDRGLQTGVSDAEGLRARLLDVSPFDRHYGLEIVEASDELVRGRVPVVEHVTQPTGLVHGGVISLLLDQVLGHAVSTSGRPGMTGTLTIVYRQGTPLGDLRCEAWVDRREGIKTWGKGRMLDADGQVTAEAEGVFILPRWARDLDAWQAAAEATEAG